MVMAAYIEGRATLKGLLKSWSVSYIGNLVGCLAVAKASHIHLSQHTSTYYYCGMIHCCTVDNCLVQRRMPAKALLFCAALQYFVTQCMKSVTCMIN
jgi:hypothetical protein